MPGWTVKAWSKAFPLRVQCVKYRLGGPFMQHSSAYSLISTAALGLSALAVVMGIITFPDESFHASLQGLTIWWEIVFPALLPYLILSEMMLAQGVVHWIGAWLEPLMRTFFRLPGISGWAIAIGLTAGTPAGAEITARLRKQGQINRHEGETLLALSSLCNPIFLISVISVGFFGQAELAVFIMAVHYITALLVGLLWVWGPAQQSSSHKNNPLEKQRHSSLWVYSYHAMTKARQADGRSLGKLLGDSVSGSIQALMMIGGFMMIFSVLIKLFELVIWPGEAGLWLSGIMEFHLGAYALSQSDGASIWTMSFLCAVLSFSGLCIHAQVKSFIRATDLRYVSFLTMKLQHALLSFGLAFISWKPYQHWMLNSSQTVFQPAGSEPGIGTDALHWITFIPKLSLFILPALLAVLLITSLMIKLSSSIIHR
jgi:sporulation integral membrane protein YlbJ